MAAAVIALKMYLKRIMATKMNTAANIAHAITKSLFIKINGVIRV